VRADLHTHSSASDGTRPPPDVVARAAAAGLDAVALTDHDTVAGVAAAAAALPAGLALVSGMELSCRRDGHSVHLLGYLFDPEHAELAEQTRAIRASRIERGQAMVAKLAELGTGVTWDQVTSIAGDAVIGRPHIARAMVQAGVIGSVDEAFTPQWIGPGGRAHVRRYALDPADAIALVHAAGGVTVLAHPLALRRGWALSAELITELAAAGLDGVEVAHPDHDEAQRNQLSTLAGKLGLAKTGGSDDHGELTGDRIGSEWTDAAAFRALLGKATGTPVITG
jgi:3',5'-nucleoside bisphosphate phosphatase